MSIVSASLVQLSKVNFNIIISYHVVINFVSDMVAKFASADKSLSVSLIITCSQAVEEDGH